MPTEAGLVRVIGRENSEGSGKSVGWVIQCTREMLLLGENTPWLRAICRVCRHGILQSHGNDGFDDIILSGHHLLNIYQAFGPSPSNSHCILISAI